VRNRRSQKFGGRSGPAPWDGAWQPIETLLPHVCHRAKFRRCRSNRLEISPFDRAHTDFLLTFYSNHGSISCRFWDVQCQKCRDLEIRAKGHSRSFKVVPLDRLRMVSYYCYWVTLSLKCTSFGIFDLEVYSDLETRVLSHLRSSKMILFDPPAMTSY